MMSPILDQLAKEVGDRAVIAKVNVDISPYATIKYHIQGIPNLKLFAYGQEVAGFVGVQPLEKLKDTIMAHV